MRSTLDKILNFNIDDHINPHLRHVPLSRLPKPISHFLGHRDKPQPEAPNLIKWFWAFVGAFLGLAIVGAMFRYSPILSKHNPPIMIASLGAAAILDYNTTTSPLAQPRNALFGQLISSLTGISILKLSLLTLSSATNPDNDNDHFASSQYLLGALSTATASALMGLTGCIHPPGGATALLALTNAQVIDMGWMYVCFVMLGTTVMLVVALGVNNLGRVYPVYWWTGAEVGRVRVLGGGGSEEGEGSEVEGSGQQHQQCEDLEKVITGASFADTVVARSVAASERTIGNEFAHAEDSGPVFERSGNGGDAILVTGRGIEVPLTFGLSEEEMRVLDSIQRRLATSRDNDVHMSV